MAAPAHVLQLKLDDLIDVTIRTTIIAGWTGRDHAALQKHVAELEALGVKPPASTPIFYRVAASRLTTASVIEVMGASSSGEAEFVLLHHGGRLWVGVGSDHTDRDVEIYNITVSKQMCEKPVSGVFWEMSSVAEHWDSLVLRSYVHEAGERILYQEGPVSAMLSPAELLSRWDAPFEEGSLMFCGTLAAHGGIRPSGRFEFELEDPILERRLSHAYDILSLPVAG
jgi:hypothetical protein